MPLLPRSFPTRIPARLTPATVCRILNCSPAVLLNAIRGRVIEIIPAARASIRRADVERILGRNLTLEDLEGAWRAGDQRRQVNKRYYIAKGLRGRRAGHGSLRQASLPCSQEGTAP